MAQAQDLRRTIGTVADHPGPLLSAYLSVNADIPENQGRAYLVRLRDAVNDLGVPEGLQETVTALQEENRIYHLAVLWELEGEVRWSDGLAILDITREESPYSGGPTRVRPLIDVLVDLAAARGARLDFIRGENENADTLRDEFGGVAGLTRF